MTIKYALLILLLVSGTQAKVWKSLVDIREEMRTTNITFTIALHQNQLGVKHLEHLILDHLSNPDSDRYGQYLTIDQINELVSPSKTNKDMVKTWLARYGFSSYHTRDFGDSIQCTGKIEQVNSLLKVVLLPHFNTITGELKFMSTTPYVIYTKRIKSYY